MQRNVTSFPIFPLLVLAACSLTGCRSNGPAAPVAALAPGPGAPTTPTATQDVRLPNIDCLVNAHGIQVKVLVVQPGARCLDRAPAGQTTGATLKYFRPYFVFDVSPSQGEAQFYQVGATPRRDSIIGWLPTAAAVRWDTRASGPATGARTEA